MSKQELAQLYEISSSTLRRLLNDRFYLKLEPLGYVKEQQILSPKVIRAFKELYGYPLTKLEFEL